MDEHKDTEPSAPAAGSSGDAAATPPSEPVIELASIESPPLAPSIIETAGIDAHVEAPKFEAQLETKPEAKSESRSESKPASKPTSTFAGTFDEIKPTGSRYSGRAAGDMIVFPAIEAKRAGPRFGKFALLAVSIVVAAAVGAMAGALGASGIARWAPPAPVAETAAPEALTSLHAAIAQLRTEVAALKTSVDANNHSANTQFAKLTDRIERAQADLAAKPTKTSDALERHADSVALKDVTGSVTLPPVAAAAPVSPPPMPQPAIVPGWVLRDVYRGAAILQGRMGAMVEVAPGDVLPGLGRIESIRRQDGQWVVFTSRGMITSMR
jgi:hypothetical protein